MRAGHARQCQGHGQHTHTHTHTTQRNMPRNQQPTWVRQPRRAQQRMQPARQKARVTGGHHAPPMAQPHTPLEVEEPHGSVGGLAREPGRVVRSITILRGALPAPVGRGACGWNIQDGRWATRPTTGPSPSEPLRILSTVGYSRTRLDKGLEGWLRAAQYDFRKGAARQSPCASAEGYRT